MRHYDWPDANSLAVFMVMGRHHCGVTDCCGPITAKQRVQIDHLTANLAGLDRHPEPMMECEHPDLKVSRDGEFYREECPDCGYKYEIDEDENERSIR